MSVEDQHRGGADDLERWSAPPRRAGGDPVWGGRPEEYAAHAPDADELDEPAVGDRLAHGAKVTAHGAKATARGVASAARGAGRAGRYAARQAQRAANAEGARESGLSRLLVMHAFNTAGDAAVTISLAGSLFFTVPSGQARGQVALFLGLTMLPFAVVAPLIGPFLDRFSHGRRWAIGATMAVRAFLCWVLSGTIHDASPLLFAAALGVLVSSKAYGVTKAAAVPRLLPDGFTLVRANGRVSMAGIVAVSVSAPLAGLAALAGAQWTLRYAFVLFVAATVAAILLPGQVDDSRGEGELLLRGEPTPDLETTASDGDGVDVDIDRWRAPAEPSWVVPPPRDARRRASLGAPRRTGTTIPTAVAFALRANCGPRWLSGFVLMFMAFLLREHAVGGLSPELSLGFFAGSLGLGNFIGVAAASTLKRIKPALTVTLVLLADAAVGLVTAVFYGLGTVLLLGLVAGLGQALAKFSLDATIQADIPPRVQASAFARSDTTLQVAWVVGGFVGIALPLKPHLGLSVAFVVLLGWAAYVISTRGRDRRPDPRVRI